MEHVQTRGGSHVASVKLLLIVWVALMVGTWLTVSVTHFDFGVLNIWIGLAIATGKALLVGLYYMHLRWDKPFNAFAFISSFAILALMIGLMLMDTSQNQPEMIPNFGEAVAAEAPEAP